MDRFWVIFSLALAVMLPLLAGVYFYLSYPAEFEERPVDEAGFLWQPDKIDSELVIDTPYSRAKLKAQTLRRQFTSEHFDEVESEIAAARREGFTPWYHGSWQSFYFDHLREDTDSDISENDVERAKLWVEHAPQSTYAYTYLGNLYYDLGWEARGTEFRNKTPEESFVQMHEYFNLAISEYEHALKLDQGNVYASRQLLEMSRTGKFGIDQEAVLDSAVANNPKYYYLYQSYLTILEPRWGGNVEAMFAFARKYTAKHSPHPTLSRLITRAHEYRAKELAEDRSKLETPVNGKNFNRKTYLKEYYKYFKDETVWQEYSDAFTTILMLTRTMQTPCSGMRATPKAVVANKPRSNILNDRCRQIRLSSVPLISSTLQKT
jgi:hypothetical protein